MTKLKDITGKVGLTAVAVALVAGLAACSPVEPKNTSNASAESESTEQVAAVQDGEFDFTYSNRDLDASYDENTATKITMSGASASVNGNGASATDGVIKITQAGTYVLSGSFTGNVEVAASETDKVQIVLAGAEITGTDTAINATSADKVFISLADGTSNSLIATAAPVSEDGADGALWAACDLTVQGNGSLTVTGAVDGIKTKDDLAITGGNITVNAADDAIVGHDSLKITSANVTVSAKSGDALKVSEADKEGKGFVSIDSGTLKLTSTEDDGISASRYVRIAGGIIDIDVADKGIACDSDLVIEDGSVAIRANGDGIHADYSVTVRDGNVTIDKSNEGIESQSITISGGMVAVIAKDDGINASKAGESVENNNPMGDVARECVLTVSGGYLYVDAGGDGLDSNGSIDLSGGTVVVNGPADNANCAIDAGAGTCTNGALVISIGSSGMFESFSNDSTVAFIESDVSVKGGDTVSVVKDGQVIISMTASKAANKLQASAPGMAEGDEYQIVIGGDTVQSDAFGVATSGVVSGGEVETTVSASFTGTGNGFAGGPGGPASSGGPGSAMPQNNRRPS